MMNAIEVKNLKKSFRIPHERFNSLKGQIIHFRSAHRYTEKKILKNISFTVQEGEFLAIVGRNGSGKSTLLKLLSGIYVPDGGSIDISGRISPFLELGVGFNPELTARENIYVNGSILGLSRKEITRLFDEIIAFAELEEFVDQKLKNFSSGMQVRLAFSVAIRAHAPILLMDEVLAVGDAVFQEKCFDVFRRMKEEGRTMVFVTHDMSAIEKFCDTLIILRDGEIDYYGSVKVGLKRYQAYNKADSSSKLQKKKLAQIASDKGLKVKDFSLQANEQTNQAFAQSGQITFTAELEAVEAHKRLNAGIEVRNSANHVLFFLNTKNAGHKLNMSAGETRKVSISFENFLPEGLYSIGFFVADGVTNEFFITEENLMSFKVEKNPKTGGLFAPQASVTIR